MSLPQQSNPPKLDQGAAEDITYGIDCTALVSGVETVTVPVVTLTGPLGAVTLADAPVVSGTVVLQRIRAAVLTAGDLYRLTTLITPSGTTNVLAVITAINCPF